MPRVITSLVLIFSAFLSLESRGQDAARDRLEREAASQAAQADKLLKAGQHQSALKLYQAERESRKALGDARYEALACRGIGCCLAELDDIQGAIDAFSEARRLDADRDDKGFEGYDGLMMAKIYLHIGRLTDCVMTLELALPKLDQAVDRDHECDARICMVTARLGLGQAEKGRSDARRAITLAEELDDSRRLADAWLGSGLIDHELGHLSLAFERIQDARDAYREQDRPTDLAKATRHLAHLSVRLGRLDHAVERFSEALAIHTKLGDRDGEASDRMDLASIHIDTGDSAATIREAVLARDLFKTSGDEASEIEALVILAQGQSRAKAGLEVACESLKEAISLGTKVYRDVPVEQIKLLILSADLEHQLDRDKAVQETLDSAWKLASNPEEQNLVTKARTRVTRPPNPQPK